MARIKSVLAVSKSVEQTFAFLSTCESHLKIIPRAVQFQQTSEGSFGRVGATADAVIRYFGVNMIVQYEIVEHVVNGQLAMKGKLGPIRFEDGYILSPTPSGTQITFWLELTLKGLAKLFTPFVWLIGKVHAWETLAKLSKELN